MASHVRDVDGRQAAEVTGRTGRTAVKRVAVVGVGLLGTAVAGRLLDAGFEVAGSDIRPEAVDRLVPRGLRAARSAREAADGADVVFTVLPSLESVDQVVRDLLDVPSSGGAGPAAGLTGPAAGLAAPAAGLPAIVQMSTVSPELSRTLGAAAAARGRAFLDAPMSGTSAMVARGDCTIFVGGDAELLEACRSVFDAIARKTIHVGGVGMASLAKLATNLLVALNTAALAEALVLGAKGGLEPARLLGILRESAAASRMVDVRGPLMVERSFEPQMKLELFMKDLSLMLEEGKRVGAPLFQTSLVRELAAVTAARGHGGEDLAVLITTLEALTGLGG